MTISLLEKKLFDLGFSKRFCKEDNRYVFEKVVDCLEDKFKYEFVVFETEVDYTAEMYIHIYESDYITTIPYDELIVNHDGLSTGAKKELLVLEKELLPLGVLIYNGDNWIEEVDYDFDKGEIRKETFLSCGIYVNKNYNYDENLDLKGAFYPDDFGDNSFGTFTFTGTKEELNQALEDDMFIEFWQEDSDLPTFINTDEIIGVKIINIEEI